MSEKPIKILLLGSPVVEVNGSPLQIKRRNVRSVLYYLACQGQPVGRSELILLLWPDEAESTARANVRDLLSKLRAQLPDPDLIILQDDQILIDTQRIWVDVLEFRSMANEALHTCESIPYNQPLPPSTVKQMEEAVSLWRSQRFMAGSNLPSNWEFEQWQILSSTEMESLRLSLLERLARHFYLANVPESSLRYLRAAIETDELNFDLHAMLLSCLDQLGRTNEAISYCRYLRNLLDNNGIEEMPSHLQKFCEKFQTFIRSDPGQRINWPITMQISTPFIGRQTQLEDLRISFQKNSAVTITGEAGIGKSRLIYEFYQRLVDAPHIILIQCNPNEIEIPLMPLREALRRGIEKTVWQKVEKQFSGYLQSLFPEFEDWQTILQAPMLSSSSQGNRYVIFEAIRQLLLLQAEKKPICILVEDAHWAEQETFAFLRYLCEKGFFRHNHRLILTLREDVQNPMLEEIQRAVLMCGPIHALEIPDLTLNEIAQFAQVLLGRSVNQQVCQQLAEETGGNPLFLIEILQSIPFAQLDEQEISEQLSNTPLPGSMRTIIRDRLQFLTGTDQQVLLTAALIGRTFEPALLEAATGLFTEQVTSTLEKLEQSHLIQADPQHPVPGAYKFVHEKIRELLVQDLSSARRRLIHTRIARALESQGKVGINRSALLAVHYEFGGEARLAFHYWIQAANYARRLFSRTSAHSAYSRADNLVRLHEHLFSDEDVLNLYTSWGEMAYDFNDIETVSTAYHTLERIGQERGSRLLVGSALSGTAMLDKLKFKMDEGLVFVERALALLETTDHLLEKMKANFRLGNLLTNQNRHREAIQALSRVIDLAGDNKYPEVTEVRLNAEQRLALVYNMTGWPGLALEHAQIALEESLREYLPLITLKTRSVLSYVHLYLGNYKSAFREARNGILQAESAQHYRIAGFLKAIAARIQLARGLLDESWNYTKQAMEIGREWNYPDVLSESFGVFGDLYRMGGDYQQACHYFGRGSEVGVDNFQTLNNLARLGICRIECGENRIGLSTLEKAMRLALENDLGTIYLVSKVSLLSYRARVRLPIENEAAELDQLQSELENRKFATSPHSIRMIKAQLAVNRGEIEEARQQLKSVIELSQSFENKIFGQNLLPGGCFVKFYQKMILIIWLPKRIPSKLFKN